MSPIAPRSSTIQNSKYPSFIFIILLVVFGFVAFSFSIILNVSALLAILFIVIIIAVAIGIRQSAVHIQGKNMGMAFGIGFIGIVVGGLLGYLLRPSAPLIGQLPFETVITQGANLRGLDQILVSFAQTSFNYLIVGMIIGGVCGALTGIFLKKKT